MQLFTIELEEPLEEEEIVEVIVVSSRRFSSKAKIIQNVNSGIDGSSYEISLCNFVRNINNLENLWNVNFYISNFNEYIIHFPNITIDISLNHLKDDHLIKILQTLSDEKLDLLRKKLVKLNIEQNRIEKKGFLELFRFIDNCPNFKELEASINLLGQKGFYQMKETGVIPECIRDTFSYSSF